MSVECRQQAFIEAPLDQVWRLAADPDRQTEWCPGTLVLEKLRAAAEAKGAPPGR